MNNYLKDLTILYVEDEKEILCEIEQFLGFRFKKVYSATDGKEGLASFKEHSPDIVLTDITMPNMDGLKMSEEIKKTDSAIPIVLMTALSDNKAITKAINLGIDGYITKPVNTSKLIEVLEKNAEKIVLKKNLEREKKLLLEYKMAVDESALVSKTDIKGTITYVNDAFCESTGYSRDEAIGNKHSIVRHPDTPDATFKELWSTIKSKKIWRGKIKNRKKDGSAYFVNATVVPITDENDEIIEFLALRQDVTELEEYRELLEKQLDISTTSLEEKVLFLKEHEEAIEASNAFSKTDTEGIITYANDMFCELSGFTREELIGQSHSIMRDKEKPDSFYKEMWGTIKAKKIWKGVFKNRTKEGQPFYLDTTIVPIVNLEGNIIEYMSIRHDVSELVFLNHEIEETQREVIATMGAIGETRSKETGNHVKRVAEYSKIMALKFGLDEEEAELIKMASPMHDIGKVGIPDNILNKPGKLTFEEFEHMKEHAAMGYEMLKSSKRATLKAAATIALEHHEKWDGTGYPHAKTGSDIHIYGRITAVADVFDALGSDRVYKKAWSLEQILDLFKEQRGIHFDPALIDIFFSHLDEFLQIRENLKDD